MKVFSVGNRGEHLGYQCHSVSKVPIWTIPTFSQVTGSIRRSKVPRRNHEHSRGYWSSPVGELDQEHRFVALHGRSKPHLPPQLARTRSRGSLPHRSSS